MKMTKIGSMFFAVAFLATASVAMAGAYGEAGQPEETAAAAPATAEGDEFSPFAYAALGGLYSEEFFSGDATPLHNAYGWGLSARAGYRFLPNLGVELLYEHAWYDADAGTDRSAWTLMPNAKVYLWEAYCEPFVSVGGGVIGADNGDGFTDQGLTGVKDGYGFAGRFGAGIDTYATENIFVEAEVAYVLATGDASNYDHLNAGLSIGYAFN